MNLSFAELKTTEAKQKARAEVLGRERAAFQRDLEKARRAWATHKHFCISDRNYVPSLVRHARLIARLSSDKASLDAMIEGNLCEFREDGTYVTYL